MRNVPLFGVGNKALSVNVSAQERTNLYAELPKDPEANGVVLYPTPGLSTDNAAMIAITAYHKYLANDFADLSVSPTARAEW